MKKFRILPLIAIATLTGITLPLVSCKKGGDEPEPEPIDPLCFTADGEDSTVSYEAHTLTVGVDGDVDIEVSTDKTNWSKWKVQEGTTLGQVLTINNGQKLYIRNTKNTLSTSDNKYFKFVMNGKISASGNVNSMINYGEITDYCFTNLFRGCENLISAPELPATTLAKSCYEEMFEDCVSLTTAPNRIPATTLAQSCCEEMFKGCSSLTNAPELPATTLAKECYEYMFSDCVSLTTAPKLPAKTLAQRCYYGMFGFCVSLTTPPELPATTLANYCYCCMFINCSSLETAPELPATTLTECCYSQMFNGCGSLKNVPSVLPATTLAGRCYECMFQECSSLETPPELPAERLENGCYENMFSFCSSLIYTPSLPATRLEGRCYYEMFRYCEKLKVSQDEGSNLIVDFTNIDLTPGKSVYDMFFDCGGTFTGGTPTNAKYFRN